MDIRLAAMTLLGGVAITAGCGTGRVHVLQPGWSVVGQESARVDRFEVDWPYLYATSAAGLLRGKVTGPTLAWEEVGFEDTYCRDLVVLESGEILGGTTKGIRRSQDKGQTWSQSDGGLGEQCGYVPWVTCLAGCSTAVYAGTSKCGVYKSLDGGRQWSIAMPTPSADFEYHDIQCHPASCDVIWAIGRGGREFQLYRTNDGALTWDLVRVSVDGRHVPPIVMALDPVIPMKIYVGTKGAVVVSEDSGETWRVIFEDTDYVGVPRLAHDPLVEGHVYVGLITGESVSIHESVDGGETFKRIEPLKVDTYHIGGFIYSTSDGALFVATSKGVYRYME